MRERVQSGRVRGYQPTLSEFNELLELAQRGINAPDAASELSYQQGSEVTSSDKNVTKVTEEHLSALIKEAGESERLVNLRFSAAQEDPARTVDISIDPDGWTYYTVKSNDFTWALGRFHELTEMLLASRRLTTKAQYPLPQAVNSKQYYMDWFSPLWDSMHDRHVTTVRRFKESPIWLPLFILLAFAASPPSVSIAHIISLAGLALAYVAGVIGYIRWLQGTYRSYVIIAPSRLNIRSLITDKEGEPVDRGILLVTTIGVAIGVLTLIVDALR